MMDAAAPGKDEQPYSVYLDAQTATLERMASGEIGWPMCQYLRPSTNLRCTSQRVEAFQQSIEHHRWNAQTRVIFIELAEFV